MRVHPVVPLLALLACGTPDDRNNKNAPSNPNDADGDGIVASLDCDDTDPMRAPGLEDLVGDGIDNDCDGVDGVDADGDGSPSAASGGADCDDSDPSTLGIDADLDGAADCIDCDDSDPQISPFLDEQCDGIDENCDGAIDVDPDGIGVCLWEKAITNRVDVLFVIDNSCSMAEEQTGLASQAPILMDTFLGSGLDYHLGVITTDLTSDRGQLEADDGVPWVDPSTPNPTATLQAKIVAGTSGSAVEKGRDCILEAITNQALPGQPNDGFLRNDANFDVVVLSDEDDASTSVPGDFLATFQAVNDPANHTRIHSIVSPNPTCPTAAVAGLAYLTASAATGGTTVSICDGDYTPVLDAITAATSPDPVSTLRLGFDVDPATLTVHVDEPGLFTSYGPNELTWDAVLQEVGLPAPAPLGSSIRVYYTLP